MSRYTDALNAGLTVGVRAFIDYSLVEPKQDVIPFITPEQRIIAEQRKILRQEWSGLDSIKTDEVIKNDVLADIEQETRYRDPAKTYPTTPWEYRRFISDSLRELFPEEFRENTRITLVDDVGVSRHFRDALGLGHVQNHPFRTKPEINLMTKTLPLVRFGEFLTEFQKPDELGREKEIVKADVLTMPLFQS